MSEVMRVKRQRFVREDIRFYLIWRMQCHQISGFAPLSRSCLA